MVRKFVATLSVLLLVFVTGCMDVTLDVKVNKDGSGVLTQRVFMGGGMSAMMADGGDASLYKIDDLKAAAEKIGEGVTFAGVVDVTNKKGAKGFRASYNFPDITALNLQSSDESGMGQMMEGMTFEFEGGETARLTINMPGNGEGDGGEGGSDSGEGGGDSDEAGGDSDEAGGDMQTGAEGMMEGMMMEGMQQMFDGMRLWVRVRVDGTIVETNSQYVNKRKTGVTLMKMDIGEMIKNTELMEKLEGSDNPSPAAIKKVFGDVGFLRLEDQEKVVISFK
tara:strand:- start:1061 stop:1897 length:837 start_codon:yes stop_codon:yes gene_type:complete